MPLELPAQGRPWPELRDEMAAMRGNDLDWKHGRHGAYVWYASDELEDVLREAFGMFLVENGLGMRASDNNGLVLDDAFVPDDFALTVPGGFTRARA